ncbi:adenylate/guanylate cyclase domain-containing protein [Rhodocytophaga rosea]|uniref:Adenylate/guanylate cyclase domain-containing protein n=1 Tax=Rhodocytophaga rosea TaxID=2704465 RepID=A0A6C0GVB9_9BACT|nr:adenylate/guanylate cyclase domain-containing protein [Rhodocytophaga rosea]QHT71764.1 adenylate/guanylate cyclase domain-containing protein [Rhodocytophaga rosea]
MSSQSDYTSRAQRITARFPLLTFLSIQITFWIFANLLLALLMYFHAQAISITYQIKAVVSFVPLLMVSLLMVIFYGLSLGLADFYLRKGLFRKKSFASLLFIKTLISFLILTLIVLLLHFVFYDFFNIIFSSAARMPVAAAWNSFYLASAIYYFFMTLMISFINQMNRRYGPGVLVPLLLGRYRTPREEERIFLFMDLKSSTSIAEQLGHLRYSAFIRDAFSDINGDIAQYNAQIYQYVGDEIVLTWQTREGLRNFCCIRFFFACEKRLRARSPYYQQQYGWIPEFKAGIHAGKVTAVEIGEIKLEVAYHGDTINTTARIQSVCNDYGKTLLISEPLLQKLNVPEDEFETETLGAIQLKGKKENIAICSVRKTI